MVKLVATTLIMIVLTTIGFCVSDNNRVAFIWVAGFMSAEMLAQAETLIRARKRKHKG